MKLAVYLALIATISANIVIDINDQEIVRGDTCCVSAVAVVVVNAIGLVLIRGFVTPWLRGMAFFVYYKTLPTNTSPWCDIHTVRNEMMVC